MNTPHLRVAASLILAAFCGLAQANLVFAVNEGVTYRVPNEEIRARYAAIAADLSKLLKQPVQVEPVADYPSLRKGLADKAYDLALVHPAHLSIEAIKKSDYKLLAVTKGFQDYKANFLVSADSPLKSLADLKGRKLGAPDEDSITSWMVRATIRDQVGDAQQVSYVYTRYQDAVPCAVFRREQPDAGRRHRVQRGDQGLAGQGRQGAGHLEGGADQACHRQPEAVGRAGPGGARLPARAGQQRRRQEEARTDQVEGLRHLRPRRDDGPGRLARVVAAPQPRRPGR